jgi:Protein of unknown function (DUF2637)
MKPKSDPGRRARPRGEVTAALLAISAAISPHGRKLPSLTPAPGEIISAAELTAIPVIGVNLVAFYGQYTYFRGLDSIPFLMQVNMAASLESVAVYLAWQAHQARLKRDSALRLRLGAYLAGLGIGALNYWHWCAPGWKPTPLAVVFALASVISPVLWGVYSNRVSRDDLKADNLIEDHALRLGFTRWFWWTRRCIGVQRLAAWEGINSPAVAIGLYDQRRAARAAEKDRKRGGDQARDNERTPGPAGAPAPARPAPAPTAAQTPPPAHSPHPEPLPRRVSAAGAGELAAVSADEQAIVLKLVQGGHPLPGINRLCGTEGIGAPRARRILTAARTQMNGGGHDDHRTA